MSSQEDQKGGEPPDKPEPPDINLDSFPGPFNEPIPQAHSVSQPQGDTSDPVSSVNIEHGKTGSDDAQTAVEAHSTMSQESDVSSSDHYELPADQQSIEGNQGEAEAEGSAVDPKILEAVQAPASTAAQIPATTAPSNLPQTAITTATTTTTQPVATTTITSNIYSTIATLSPASTPEKEAKSAISVPGLTDPGSEEQVAEQESNITPEQIVQRAIEDHFAAHSMSSLQLGDDPISEMDPKPDNITSGGPGPSSDNQNPSVQQPLSSTPTRPLTEPQNSSTILATPSSELLGSTVHAAHDSTTSVSGFEGASNIFHRDSSSSVPAVPPTGPNVSQSVTNSDVVQDPSHDGDVDDMDTTHQDAYSQHTDENRPVVQPELNNLSSTDADQAVQLMAQLFQAQQAGNLADVTSQLHGQQAQQLMQLLQLAKVVGQPTGAGQGTSSAHPDTDTDSDPDSTTQSGSDSESVNTNASEHRRHNPARQRRLAASQAQKLLEESDKDVIVLEEQIETDELETVHVTTDWDKHLEHEEATWPTPFPTQKPFIKPRVEQVDDTWYQGEDCVDHSGIAPAAKRAILLAADGTLVLRHDAAIPGASRGRTKYRTHDLERWLSYEKGMLFEGRLMAITPVELIAHDQRQKDLFAADSFWQDEIRSSLFVPGPEDTPINFAYRSGPGQTMAIPYRVAAPMAWEYPYVHDQLQESITDRLVTASLYGIQLVRPGYYSPQSRPEGYSEAEWLRRKSQACANYVLDTDTSQCDYQPPQGSIGITSNGEEAFVCREEGCGVMPYMPCYFATAEQYTAHWNTFHVAVAPTVTCLVRGCGVKFPPGPDSLDAFFRHCKEKHEAESDGGKWGRLRNWARKGIDIGPNPHYWVLTLSEPFFPSRPSGIESLDADDMKDPIKAARWVARTSFRSKVARARPAPARDSYSGFGSSRGRGRGTIWCQTKP